MNKLQDILSHFYVKVKLRNNFTIIYAIIIICNANRPVDRQKTLIVLIVGYI
jgi:hypothetical protein